MKIFSLVFFIMCSTFCFAQPTTDEQLANQFFSNKEYEKAIHYYEKIFSKKNNTAVYENYLTSLIQIKDYKKAEKIIKNQIKNNPEDFSFGVDLGSLYKIQGMDKEAQEQFVKCIKQLGPSQMQAISLAKAFMKIKEWNYAIDTYRRAEKLIGDSYPFNFELAEVYAAKGDIPAMVNEYLSILEVNEGYIQSVQNALQTNVSGSDEQQKNEIIKKELIKKIQSAPSKTIFAELLIWQQMQMGDFEGALFQAKALDKRKKEEGSRVMGLAGVFASNNSFDVAIKAYEYVIAVGPGGYHYTNARIEWLSVMYKKIVDKGNYTHDDLLQLRSNYKTALNELGRQENTVPLIRNYAHLEAFYLHNIDTSIALLNEAISFSRLSPAVVAACKLELGDVLLLSGDIWEASLTYSQVEKAFKHEPVGQEAKFRNARISYYTGDFKWAQAQLDVLKGATSKLIANDAMDLSMVITDNLGVDTNVVPLHMFARADLLAYQNKDDEALKLLDSLSLAFTFHALADDILYKKYEIMMKKKKFDEAAGFLEKIKSNYSFDILGDDATFKLAQMNETIFKNKEKAMELYQDVLVNFPGSLYVVEARKRYRQLRGDAVN